jgi:2-oxoglutarate ferredoxin oxidoreductase subunit alpha
VLELTKLLREISCLVGGKQGEGIESVGEMFSLVTNRMGYFVHTNRVFSSRIKGGNSYVKIRVSNERTFSSLEHVHIIIAFDQPTLDINAAELTAGGIVIADKGLVIPTANVNKDIRFLNVDFKKLAMETGATISKNMVALGCLGYLLQIPIEHLEQIIQQFFGKKGTAIVEKNNSALQVGYQTMEEQQYPHFILEEGRDSSEERPLILSGNEAISLGSIAGGCKLIAGYPITPATEVLENLSNLLPTVGGVSVQAEDELAAINIAIGAGISGVRSMTATSGPGLSLMQESIGLAGMTETPLVIVDLQRGGPSSGMATKHEQSDLFAMLYGSHGEVQRIIISPSTVEEAFYDMIRAFNYSEIYQCPVIVAADLGLATCKQTMPWFDLQKISIDRGTGISNDDLLQIETSSFPRYAFTENNISPRSIPGQPKGVHHITGIEHSELGYPSENPTNRTNMVDKRRKKIEQFTALESDQIKFEGSDDFEILLVGFGSSFGAIQDARKEMEQKGHKVAHAHIRVLSPFPIEQFRALTKQSRKMFVIENNSTGQLATLIKQDIPCHDKLVNVTMYSGLQFTKSDIVNKVTEGLSVWK